MQPTPGRLIVHPSALCHVQSLMEQLELTQVDVHESDFVPEGRAYFIPDARPDPYGFADPIEIREPLERPWEMRELLRRRLSERIAQRLAINAIGEARGLMADSGVEETLDPHLGGDEALWRRYPDVDYAAEIEAGLARGEELTFAEVLAKWKAKGADATC